MGAGHDPLYVKNRFFIVVAQHQSSYTSVPLYTHKGNGLDRKDNKDEYVSIRDHRNTNPYFEPQGQYPALVISEFNARMELHEKSTAWVTYAISRMYVLPVVIEGFLDERSTMRLIQLYNKYAPTEAAARRRDMANGATQGRQSTRDVDSAAEQLMKYKISAGNRVGQLGNRMETMSIALSVKMGPSRLR